MRGVLSTIIAFALIVVPASARADDDHRLVWRWRRFDNSEAIYATAAWASFGSVSLLSTHPSAARWEGGILFDDAVRDALVFRTPRARAIAGIVSDVLWIGINANVWAESLLFPLVFDHGNTDVAFQATAIDFEAFGPVTLVSHATRLYSARARPSTPDCQKDPSYEPYCGARGLSSFPSGHAATSFVAAALSCAHHHNLRIYGNAVADDFACGALLGIATTTSLLRIAADRHYATDVLVGGALGLVVGYAVPTLLHYDHPRASGAPTTTTTPSPLQIGMSGAF